MGNAKKYSKAFISYAREDSEVGFKVKEVLKDFGISAFLAHEDINPSAEWPNRIMEELNAMDLFIPLLSNHFNKSCYCMQEVGVGVFRDVPIIPMSIDGVKPNGFLDKTQSKQIKFEKDAIADLLISSSQEIMINTIVGSLKNNDSIKDKYKILLYLEKYFKDFTDNQVVDLVNIIINDSKIYRSDKCCKLLKSKFYKLNKDKMSSKVHENFKQIFRCLKDDSKDKQKELDELREYKKNKELEEIELKELIGRP